jgi:S1-C subfamily serine protease
MERIADYAASVVRDIADTPELPPFDSNTAQSVVRQPSAQNRRIAFGTVPDFTEGKDGFRITGTTPGSTAEGIGLARGDRIVSFGGKPIADIYDFMEALGTFKGGDKAVVKWIRDGKDHQAEATLRER